MTNWVDELIPQYKEGRKELREMKRTLPDDGSSLDKSQVNGMIDSMSFSLEWMEVGRQPGLFRGIDKRDAYRSKQYEDMDIIPDITEHLRMEREPLYMDQEQRQVLLQLFESFSDRERECFIMYEAEQLSMQKIADCLGITKATVQSYISRARKKVEGIAA